MINVLLMTGLLWLAGSLGDLTPHAGVTTESSCNFGFGKGQHGRCEVPMPGGCSVAQFPGTQTPWASVSKGGVTTCRFSAKETDWKRRITGVCDRCRSAQCSARFGVMFDCSGLPPPPPAR